MKCALAHCARGRCSGSDLCRPHLRRRLAGALDWDAPIRVRGEGKKCKQCNCLDAAIALGYCRRHYQRQHYGLPMDRPPQVRLERGTRLNIHLPGDVVDALRAEGEARGLTLNDVAREKLTALMRMRRNERRQWAPAKAEAWKREEMLA